MDHATTTARPERGCLERDRTGERRADGAAAAGRRRPARAPHPTATRAVGEQGVGERAVVCTGCGAPGRTREEAADLAVDWLVYDPATGAATTARFHQGCRPAGIPGELTCTGCGDGLLLDPILTDALTGAGGPGDLFTTAALAGWLDEHSWTGDPHATAKNDSGLEVGIEDAEVGEGSRCPACAPRPAWAPRSARARRLAPAGAPR